MRRVQVVLVAQRHRLMKVTTACPAALQPTVRLVIRYAGRKLEPNLGNTHCAIFANALCF